VNNTVCLILLINQSIALLQMALVYIGYGTFNRDEEISHMFFLWK